MTIMPANRMNCVVSYSINVEEFHDSMQMRKGAQGRQHSFDAKLANYQQEEVFYLYLLQILFVTS